MNALLNEKLNELNRKYHATRLKLFKMNAKPKHFIKLNEFRKKHEATLIEKHGDDLTKLNMGKIIIFKGRK